MKKGFTLIELLAVIVILAILSLIAVPIVINLIKDAQEESAKRSLNNYIHAVNLAISNYNSSLENSEIDNATCNILSNGDLDCNGKRVSVGIKNTPATSGNLIIIDYRVKDYYGVTINSKSFDSIEFNATLVPATSNDTHKGIVYMDPVKPNTVCTAADVAANVNVYGTSTEVKNGCMRFYIFDDSGDSYKMILDHNTTKNVEWISYDDSLGYVQAGTENWGPYAKTQVTVNKQLLKDTATWVGSPRLITADEIAHIVGADAILDFDSSINSFDDWFHFDGSGTTFRDWQEGPFPSRRYAWLYNNTMDCTNYGCEVADNYIDLGNTIQGYWTSSLTNNYGFAWMVSCFGNLGVYTVNATWAFGVRPVITLPKRIFE